MNRKPDTAGARFGNRLLARFGEADMRTRFKPCELHSACESPRQFGQGGNDAQISTPKSKGGPKARHFGRRIHCRKSSAGGEVPGRS
jgi:hypothetical protein